MSRQTLYWEEMLVDLSRLKDRELDAHIEGLMKTVRASAGDHDTQVVWMSSLLVIAAAEKNSRASSRLAKTAISIALVGVFIAAAGIWI